MAAIDKMYLNINKLPHQLNGRALTFYQEIQVRVLSVVLNFIDMKIEDMLEKIGSLNEKVEELKKLKKILKGIDYGHKESNHFEFVEHYGFRAITIHIPKKYNQRVLDVISQIADEIEEELKVDFSKLEEQYEIVYR